MGQRASMSPGSPQSPHDWLRHFIATETGNESLERSDAAIDGRLRSLLTTHKFGSAADLVDALRTRPSAKLSDATIAALMNNETSFFRDPHCFDKLAEEVLPALIEARSRTRTLTLWSAACSTGQEPVSLAILLHELLGASVADWRITIVASDISSEAIGRTKRGRFSTLEMQRGLSDARRQRFFRPDRDAWKIDDSLKRIIKPRVLNLIEPWPTLPRMDLVLLRNVLIYLSSTARDQLLGQLARQLKPDGRLILGAPESLIDSPLFHREVHGRLRVYRPQSTE